VGVGQSETAVSRLTDFFLLLMLAGGGDELQGIKRGIMELADSVVITKADGQNLDKAKSARSEFARALHLMQPPASGWTPRVVTCSSVTGEGIDEVLNMVNAYRELVSGGYLVERRRAQLFELLREEVNAGILQVIYAKHGIAAALEKLRKTEDLNTFSEAAALLARLGVS
jgi:LAO/AO transport system kinase